MNSVVEKDQTDREYIDTDFMGDRILGGFPARCCGYEKKYKYDFTVESSTN